LSVVVNPKNDWCDCLTVEQLKAIWQPESAVSKWSDLDPAWPEREIKLYGPGTDSGTFDYFTEAIVGKAGSSRADYSPSEDDNSLVTGVAGDADALGYFGMAYYEEMDRLRCGYRSGRRQMREAIAGDSANHSYKPLSRRCSSTFASRR
jgi:phosphate transport system substrate-binding protein